MKLEENDRGPWPCCIGLTGEDCKLHVEAVAPELAGKVYIIHPGDMYTQEIRDDRVRIFVNENGIVFREPKRG